MACLISLFPSFSVYRTYVLVWPAIYCATKHCHITPLFKKLHWLRVRLRVTFKILLLTFKVLHQIGPSYMSDLISITLPDSYNLRLVPTMAPSVFPILALDLRKLLLTVHSCLPIHNYGTTFPLISEPYIMFLILNQN